MSASIPHLIAALFCEKPLQEQDGVLSAIRIFDRVFIPKLEQNEPPQQVFPLALLLMFKSGGYKGKAKVRVVPKAPSGVVRKDFEQEIELPEQPNAGANLILNIAFAPREEGVYWFEILVNGELVTRTPLDVQLLPTQPQTQSPKNHSSGDQQKHK